MNGVCRKNQKKHPGGFTAIEIIAVIVIIAVLAVVAVSRFSSTRIFNVAAEVEILKANLRHAQYRALSDADKTQNANATTWGISVTGSSFTMQKTEGGGTTYPNLFGENSSTHNLASGINIISGLGVITFNAWGIPSLNGTPLEANLTITITDGASPKTITVTKNTGFIP